MITGEGDVKRIRRSWQRELREVTLRRRLRHLLAALKVEGPTPMAEVCRRLGEHRGRPVRLYPYVLEVPGPFGLWIKTSAADLILYQSMGTTPLHREHIVAHELGHVLADHPPDEDDDAVWRELMPDIPPEFIHRALRRRTSYDSEYEREAEIVATVLLEATARAHSLMLPGHSPRARRAQRALGDPVDLL